MYIEIVLFYILTQEIGRVCSMYVARKQLTI